MPARESIYIGARMDINGLGILSLYETGTRRVMAIYAPGAWSCVLPYYAPDS